MRGKHVLSIGPFFVISRLPSFCDVSLRDESLYLDNIHAKPKACILCLLPYPPQPLCVRALWANAPAPTVLDAFDDVVAICFKQHSERECMSADQKACVKKERKRHILPLGTDSVASTLDGSTISKGTRRTTITTSLIRCCVEILRDH